MKKYTYQNSLISKKQLKSLLSWSFTKYGSLKAGNLADKLKYLGFKYATSAGISISIEDLRVPNVKNSILNKANQQVLNAQKLYLKGKITNVERFQKIIDSVGFLSGFYFGVPFFGNFPLFRNKPAFFQQPRPIGQWQRVENIMCVGNIE